MSFRRKKISVDDEKKIITSMITSTKFLKETLPAAKREYFVIPYSQVLFDWISDYYHQYHKAPERHIEDIFNVYKDNLQEEDQRLISDFLMDLSDQYEAKFNEDFYRDKALAFFRKQSIDIVTKKLRSLLVLDEIDKAEQEISNFKSVAKLTSQWENPNDPVMIDRVFDSGDGDHLFRFPGALGELLGWFDREMLVAVQAGYGIGKSLMLQEMRILAMQERLSVVEFNLELGSKRLAKRYYRRITSSGDQGGHFIYPAFDCYHNQVGDCHKAQRTNDISLIPGGNGPKPKPGMEPPGYKVCTECRYSEQYKDDYLMEMWYSVLYSDPLTRESAKDYAKAVTKSFGDRIRLRCYPKFSANLDDIQRDLDFLEYSEEFIPDLAIIDYADILMPERGSFEHEESRLNATWMALARLAQERRCLVITASQIKTEAVKKQTIGRMGDASGSARAKYGHPDKVFALTQTPEDKSEGIIRCNVVKDRDSKFDENAEVLILQQLETGQPIIDSEWKPRKEN